MGPSRVSSSAVGGHIKIKILSSVGLLNELPHSDVSISESSIEDGALTVPGNGSALNVLLLGVLAHYLLLHLHKGNGGLGIAHQVPHLDALLSRGGYPLVLGVEGQLGHL